MLERRLNSEGVIRARFAGGWASETLKDGSVILELVSGTEPELQVGWAMAPPGRAAGGGADHGARIEEPPGPVAARSTWPGGKVKFTGLTQTLGQL